MLKMHGCLNGEPDRRLDGPEKAPLGESVSDRVFSTAAGSYEHRPGDHCFSPGLPRAPCTTPYLSRAKAAHADFAFFRRT